MKKTAVLFDKSKSRFFSRHSRPQRGAKCEKKRLYTNIFSVFVFADLFEAFSVPRCARPPRRGIEGAERACVYASALHNCFRQHFPPQPPRRKARVRK